MELQSIEIAFVKNPRIIFRYLDGKERVVDESAFVNGKVASKNADGSLDRKEVRLLAKKKIEALREAVENSDMPDELKSHKLKELGSSTFKKKIEDGAEIILLSKGKRKFGGAAYKRYIKSIQYVCEYLAGV